MKRVFDVLLILLSLPVLFKQVRPGLAGKPFTMMKFRSMTDERDEQGNLLPDAVRLTKFGRFLRSTSLDELPGLWSVLKGDMSLVGPRPLLMEYLPLYSAEQARRHETRPGITGWAQVNGRNAMCSIGCLTAIYDTEYFGKVTMPLIRKRQDLGLWLRLLKRSDYAYGLNEPLAQYRVRADSISANKANAAKFTWRLYREVEGLNLVKASYYFSHYAVSGLLRTKAPGLARMLGVLK